MYFIDRSTQMAQNPNMEGKLYLGLKMEKKHIFQSPLLW